MSYLLKTLVYIDVLIALGLVLFRLALAQPQRSVVSTQMAATVLVTPIVALFSGNVYILFAYLFLAVAINFRSRLQLAGSFLFLLPSTPMLSIDTTAGGVYLIAFTTPIAMAAGAAFGMLVSKKRTAVVSCRYDISALLVVAILTFIDGRDAQFTGVLRAFISDALVVGVPYLLISRSARDLREVELLLVWWSLGATIMAVTTCFQAWRHWVLFESYYGALHLQTPLGSAATALRAGFLRTGGSMVDYTAGGVLLAAVITALPIIKKYFTALGFWLVLFILIFAVFFTQSRGAWVAAIVGILFVSAWQGKWARIGTTAVVVIGGDLLVSTIGANGRFAQILGKEGAAQGTASYRKDLATQGVQQVIAHPLIGQSLTSLQRNLANLSQGQHIVDFVNTHLFVAMAAGLPIFLIWCAVWSMLIIDAWRAKRSNMLLLVVPLAIAVPVLVALLFTSPIDRNLTWLVIALGLGVPCAAASVASRRSPMVRRLQQERRVFT